MLASHLPSCCLSTHQVSSLPQANGTRGMPSIISRARGSKVRGDVSPKNFNATRKLQLSQGPAQMAPS